MRERICLTIKYELHETTTTTTERDEVEKYFECWITRDLKINSWEVRERASKKKKKNPQIIVCLMSFLKNDTTY